MAESAPAPSPSFSGIDFNPAFFPSTTSDYLEFPVAQGTETFGTIFATTIDTPTPSADFDFLDSATANVNIGTSVLAGNTIKLGQSTGTSIHCGSIDLKGTNINNAVNSDTGTISLAPAQTTGALYIGANASTSTRTTGAINIGTTSAGVTPITIGTTGQSTIALNGTSVTATTKLLTPIIDCVTDATAGNTSLAIGPSAVVGNIVIGAALGAGDISIATAQTSGGTVTIGSSNTVTTLNGTSVKATTKLITPIIDCVTDASATNTSLSIGPSAVNGNIVIGAALGVGDVSIATAQASGGTVTIGSSNTVTTLTGTLTTALGTIAGKTGQSDVDVVTLPQTLSTSLNLDVSVTLFGGTTSGTYTIPSGLPSLQKINIKNWSTASQSIAFTTNLFYSYTNSTGVTGTTLPVNETLSIQLLSGKWFQFGPSNSFNSLSLLAPLTLPTTVTTPSISQLGFTNSVSNSAIVSVAANTLTDLLTTGTNLPLGTLLVTFNVTVTFTPATNASSMAFSFNLSSGTSMIGVPANLVMTLTGAPAKSTFTYTVPVTTTATSNNAEIQFRGTTPVGTTASIPIGSARISWIKIA